MSVTRLRQSISDFGDAVEELEEAVGWVDADKPHRDSTILRFLLAYEAAWKTLMFFLAEVGVEIANPRRAFKEAYKQGWIQQDEELWLAMIRDRNAIANIYNEPMAVSIYERVKGCAPAFRATVELLTKEFDDLLA